MIWYHPNAKQTIAPIGKDNQMINTATDKGEIVKTYAGDIRSAIWIIAVIIVIHVIVILLVANEFDASFWSVNIALFILYGLFFGIMAFQAKRITITVYENGIEWQRNGSHVFTTWDNMAKIGRRNEGDSTSYGIYLHQPIQPTVHASVDKRFFSAPVDYFSLIPTVKVPTKFKGMDGNVIDWDAFVETDFGQNIARYAPHLLQP
jgi:hypothetical protein